jgi:hypothetical protein
VQVARWEDKRMDDHGHDTDGAHWCTTSTQPAPESSLMPSEARPEWITHVEKGTDSSGAHLDQPPS